MKLFIGIALVAVAVVFVHADFLTYLKEIETHRSFERLPTSDKLIFYELVMAAETNTTQEFIDRVGLLPVLELIDRMSFADGAKFSAYLAEHLGYHHHRPENADVITKRSVDKRDRDDLFHHISGQNDYYHSHLNDAEKQLWDDLKDAANQGSVTKFIEDHGYGVIFGLVENMSFVEQQSFLNMIEKQLASEAAAAAVVVKRKDHGNSDFGHSHHWGDYFDNLNAEEQKLWNDFKAAAVNNTLTQFVAQVGYGPIFGLIENMDPQTMQTFLDMMEAQLAKEAAAAAGTVVKRQSSNHHGNSDFGHSHHWGDYFDNLNAEEQKLWDDFKAAAANNTLTDFVAQVGYGPIFGLIENMDAQTMQTFLDMMEAQLLKESIMATATVAP